MPRSNLKPWVKGQSGNPAGCPKEVFEAIKFARTKTKEALRVALSLMMDEGVPAKDRLKACEIILERGLGKAPVLDVDPDGLDTKVNQGNVNILARQVLMTLHRGGLEMKMEDAIEVTPVKGELVG